MNIIVYIPKDKTHKELELFSSMESLFRKNKDLPAATLRRRKQYPFPIEYRGHTILKLKVNKLGNYK